MEVKYSVNVFEVDDERRQLSISVRAEQDLFAMLRSAAENRVRGRRSMDSRVCW